MPSSLTIFPVDNGDMALIELSNKQNVLIDINIRAAADDPDDDKCYDVASDLKKRLPRDAEGRLYIDVFMLSHPDADHVTGLRNHFHLGKPEDFPKGNRDLILIREMWSSPIVFRRASTTHVLCEDAKAWAKEARRRVAHYKTRRTAGHGDRIMIIGEDKGGKTDDIMPIVAKQNSLITTVNGDDSSGLEARVLAPMVVNDGDEELIKALEKNNSSIIMQFSIPADGFKDKCRFLSGGDADVAIWERLWNQHEKAGTTDWLSYDVMETPHHCSWRTLSYDRWSDLGEKVKVCQEARSALSQTRAGASIVASSRLILKEEPNPPHERAKREYLSMVGNDDARFVCTSEFFRKEGRPVEFKIDWSGVTRTRLLTAAKAATAVGVSTVATTARGHG